MENASAEAQFFGREKIWKILLKIAPPVMLAQLIQALYNIVDSLFVGQYAESGLTALSIVYPIQLLMMALAIGTGVGINTAMAARFGVEKREAAQEFAGIGTPLAGILWLLFAVVSWLLMPAYASLSSPSPEVVEEVVIYGRIVCVFSFGLFFESIWTKILQAQGDMRTPMAAQILGAVTNIGLDPLLIFGLFGLPEMGIAGAAVATVIGQVAAALVVMKKGYRKSPAKEAYPRRVAQRLGIPFYYKEMTALAAQESGLDREFISGLNRNAPKALYNLYLSTKVVRLAVVTQHQSIEKIAENGSCVIVGRAADYVLREHEDVVKIFIHASREYRIARAMEVYGDSREEAEENIRRSDKARAAYYHHISGKRWGDAANYDLIVDSSGGIQQAEEEILRYLQARQHPRKLKNIPQTL